MRATPIMLGLFTFAAPISATAVSPAAAMLGVLGQDSNSAYAELLILWIFYEK